MLFGLKTCVVYDNHNKPEIGMISVSSSQSRHYCHHNLESVTIFHHRHRQIRKPRVRAGITNNLNFSITQAYYIISLITNYLIVNKLYVYDFS